MKRSKASRGGTPKKPFFNSQLSNPPVWKKAATPMEGFRRRDEPADVSPRYLVATRTDGESF